MTPWKPGLQKVISGGQTGVDRAALDAALELGIAIGGWCPKGRRAEDGPIHSRYPLQETATDDYAERTERNVLEADGTLILFRDGIAGGTALTVTLARMAKKPLFLLDLSLLEDIGPVIEWIAVEGIQVLNVAGPRESQAPGIYHQARSLVLRLISTAH